MLKITKTRVVITYINDESFVYDTWSGDTVPADDAQIMLERFEGDDQIAGFEYQYFVPDEDRWYTQAEVNEIKDVWRRFHYR